MGLAHGRGILGGIMDTFLFLVGVFVVSFILGYVGSRMSR